MIDDMTYDWGLDDEEYIARCDFCGTELGEFGMCAYDICPTNKSDTPSE